MSGSMRTARLRSNDPLTPQNRAFLSWAALGLGGIMLVGSLVEFLHLAEQQQQLGFLRSATLLRAAVIAEAVLVILTAALALRLAGRATALVIIASLALLLRRTDVNLTPPHGGSRKPRPPAGKRPARPPP